MLKISEHAYDRMKERFRYNRSAAERMAKYAFEKGLAHGDSTGKIDRYLANKNLYAPHKGACAKVYGEVVYCFIKHGADNYSLATVYALPNELKTQATRIQKKLRSRTESSCRDAAGQLA